jgi:hypothetical protein
MIKDNREETKARREETETRKGTGQEQINTEIKTGLEKVKATDSETNPEETEAVREQQEVPSEEIEVETVAIMEDGAGDQGLAVGSRNQLKIGPGTVLYLESLEDGCSRRGDERSRNSAKA